MKSIVEINILTAFILVAIIYSGVNYGLYRFLKQKTSWMGHTEQLRYLS